MRTAEERGLLERVARGAAPGSGLVRAAVLLARTECPDADPDRVEAMVERLGGEARRAGREAATAEARARVLAVATGAWRDEVEGVLGSLGIRDRFRVVISMEDCAVGKPDPAPFLRALEALNASAPAPEPPLQARECLVIEDSPHGIAAARAAGMRSVGLTTTGSADALRDADLVAPHYRALDLRRVAAFFDRRAR